MRSRLRWLVPLIIAGTAPVVSAQESSAAPVTTRRAFGVQGFSGHFHAAYDVKPVKPESDIAWTVVGADKKLVGDKFFWYYDSRDAGFTNVGTNSRLEPWFEVTFAGRDMQLTGTVDYEDGTAIEDGLYLGNLSYIGGPFVDPIPVYAQNKLLSEKVILEATDWPPDRHDFFRTYRFKLASNFTGRIVITGANIVADVPSEGTPDPEKSTRTVDFLTPSGQRNDDSMFTYTGDWTLKTYRVEDTHSPTIHNLRYLNGSGNAEVTIRVPANTTTLRVNGMIGHLPIVTITPVSRPDKAQTIGLLSPLSNNRGNEGTLWFNVLDPTELYNFSIAGNLKAAQWPEYGVALTSVEFESYYSDGHSDPVTPEMYDWANNPGTVTEAGKNTDNDVTNEKNDDGASLPNKDNSGDGTDGTRSSAPASANGHKVNVGAIAGGIVGGLIVLLLLLLLAFWIGRRRRNDSKPADLNGGSGGTPVTAVRPNNITPFSEATEHLRAAPFIATPAKVAAPTPFSKADASAQPVPLSKEASERPRDAPYPIPLPLRSMTVSEGTSTTGSGWGSSGSSGQSGTQASVEVEFEEDAGLLQPMRRKGSVPRAVLPPNYNPQWADDARQDSEPDEEMLAAGPPRLHVQTEL